MTTKTILVTRPPSEDSRLTDALHERGMRTICEPLTQIFLLHDARHAIEDALKSDPHALILTSQHGVHALAALSPLRDLSLVCVGEATQHAAQLHGYTRSYSADGDAARLIDYIEAAYDPESTFVYVSARDIRTDIVAELSSRGMQIERIIAYAAEPVERLSDTVCEQFRRNYIDAITFFSARASEHFVRLIKEAGLEDLLVSIEAYAFSDAVAEPLRALDWKKIHTAHQPTLASMLACMDNDDTMHQQHS